MVCASSPEEIAWAAGLFEGEGFFSASRYQRADGGTTSYLVAGLTSTDKDVLMRFHRIVGVGYIFLRQLGDQSGRGIVQRKPQWRWQAAAQDDFTHVAELFRPYLGERRLARLTELLDLRAT